MDVLSEMLRAVRLEGALFFNAEFSAPWCVSTRQPAAIAQRLSPGDGHLILFHFLTEGRAYARLADGRKEELAEGDIVIFPHGDPHLLGNGSPERPVDSLTTFSKNLSDGLKLVQFGGGGEITRFVCGFLTCEPRLSEVFLAGLPPMIRVPVSDEASGQWLKQSLRFTVDAAAAAPAGTGLVLEKLSEVLFVETLRRYLSTLPSDETGWFAAARDPFVGQALAHLHREPSYPWTLTNLARRVGLSRTRLADRFRQLLGESPIAYLTRWRLKLGAETLQSTRDSVAEIAAAVGYGSEAAFNRAFKREFACPPAKYRRGHSTPETAPGSLQPVP